MLKTNKINIAKSNQQEDCKFYIPSLDMYGRKNNKYGSCSNRVKFTDKKQDFSIYDNEVCWMLIPRIAPNGCEKCVQYKHKNIVSQQIYLIRRVLRTTGITRPSTWGWILDNLIHPCPKCERCDEKHGNK
jgi:hypothetical protein